MYDPDMIYNLAAVRGLFSKGQIFNHLLLPFWKKKKYNTFLNGTRSQIFHYGMANFTVKVQHC